jgi:predicted dehydrogenase
LVCEKPLAITHEGLKDLRRVVDEKKVLCISMLGNRVNPVLEAAREIVASGRIGEVVLVNASKSYKWGERPVWFGARAKYGGTIGWIGIHGLDFIHTVTGQDFVSVAAMQSNLVKKERPECEDNCALVLGLSGGGHATLSVDFLRPSAAATHGDDRIRVVGSKGVLEGNMTRRTLVVTTSDRAEESVALGEEGDFYGEFFAAVREGRREVLPDMRKAFYLTHVSLCARDSADEGRVVGIEVYG